MRVEFETNFSLPFFCLHRVVVVNGLPGNREAKNRKSPFASRNFVNNANFLGRWQNSSFARKRPCRHTEKVSRKNIKTAIKSEEKSILSPRSFLTILLTA